MEAKKKMFFQKYSESTFRWVKTHLITWNNDFKRILDFRFFILSWKALLPAPSGEGWTLHKSADISRWCREWRFPAQNEKSGIRLFTFSGIPLLPEASGGAATYSETDTFICPYDLRLLADFYWNVILFFRRVRLFTTFPRSVFCRKNIPEPSLS